MLFFVSRHKCCIETMSRRRNVKERPVTFLTSQWPIAFIFYDRSLALNWVRVKKRVSVTSQVIHFLLLAKCLYISKHPPRSLENIVVTAIKKVEKSSTYNLHLDTRPCDLCVAPWPILTLITNHTSLADPSLIFTSPFDNHASIFVILYARLLWLGEVSPFSPDLHVRLSFLAETNYLRRVGVKSHVPASIKQQRVPDSPTYSLSQFTYVNGSPPLAFREPIPVAERISDAKSAIKDFDGKMNRG